MQQRKGSFLFGPLGLCLFVQKGMFVTSILPKRIGLPHELLYLEHFTFAFCTIFITYNQTTVGN